MIQFRHRSSAESVRRYRVLPSLLVVALVLTIQPRSSHAAFSTPSSLKAFRRTSAFHTNKPQAIMPSSSSLAASASRPTPNEGTPLLSASVVPSDNEDSNEKTSGSRLATSQRTKKILRFIYWSMGTLLAVWFLGVHAPPYIQQHDNFMKDPMFYLHLIGAYGIYIACIHNAMITPSIQRSMHTWIGRIGMVLGLVGFVFGAIIAMGRYIHIDPTFSIAITIGGIFQVASQYYGYKAIRKYQFLPETEVEERYKCLQTHIGCMVGLFMCACGIPAIIRLSKVPTGKDNIVLMIAGISVLNALAYLFGGTYRGGTTVSGGNKKRATEE